jgi:hypothetical protein
MLDQIETITIVSQVMLPLRLILNTIGMNDQDRCQAEANYMAANRISGHVWGCIGSFEGVGVGHSPNCNTCTPGNNMNQTGDASAQDSSGRWYRVRSWR